ncbi:hypothetical protein BAV1483 [Bordetella avium 197N]|uniref:Uncharacterized protein n=1 Tax=Bordetella avium (strain 197N) TaxID=360910 RepID=Q2L278_BORA1|nr:hypothetical protein BAV1483 [Bordetella avium 197N]
MRQDFPSTFEQNSACRLCCFGRSRRAIGRGVLYLRRYQFGAFLLFGRRDAEMLKLPLVCLCAGDSSYRYP